MMSPVVRWLDRNSSNIILLFFLIVVALVFVVLIDSGAMMISNKEKKEHEQEVNEHLWETIAEPAIDRLCKKDTESEECIFAKDVFVVAKVVPNIVRAQWMTNVEGFRAGIYRLANVYLNDKYPTERINKIRSITKAKSTTKPTFTTKSSHNKTTSSSEVTFDTEDGPTVLDQFLVDEQD